MLARKIGARLSWEIPFYPTDTSVLNSNFQEISIRR